MPLTVVDPRAHADTRPNLQACNSKSSSGQADSVRFWLALPRGCAQAAGSWPLILFLHGIGERGDDLERVKRHGLVRALVEGLDLPAIVAAPQCPAASDWVPDMDAVAALLDDLTARLPVDPARLYLTGLSMGGRGALLLTCLHLRHFAALVTICARRPDECNPAEHLAGLPVWLFHGALDPVVPVGESYQLAAALRRAGSRPRLTVYPDARHYAWTRTYRNPALYDWLFKQEREAK